MHFSNEGGENVVAHVMRQRKTRNSINAMVGRVRFGDKQLEKPPLQSHFFLGIGKQTETG
jgi:hypothetical protein